MERLSFILYTAGNSPNSIQAVSNLQEMCSTHFPDHHRIEIVDLSRDPERGLADGIMVTPTLMKGITLVCTSLPTPDETGFSGTVFKDYFRSGYLDLSELFRQWRAEPWSDDP